MGRRIGGTLLALASLACGAAPAAAIPPVEPGFPVEAWSAAGGSSASSSLAITVGSIDRDPEPEILATGMSSGPLYAWNGDGTPVPGWPHKETGGVVYPVLADLSARSPAFEVFGAARLERAFAWAGDGRVMPGWPRRVQNYISAGPMAADVDGDGLDELFYNENTSQILGRKADGRVIFRGPQVSNQQQATPAAADLDGDGDLEIVSTSYNTVYAHHGDGTPVDGFPVAAGHSSKVLTYVAIGDVDGDGELEIVVPVFDFENWVETGYVEIIGADGTIERDIEVPMTPYGPAPALADLTGDGTPDIVVQGDEALGAVRGDGTPLPGFPIALPGREADRSAPVVGDVDGDQRPDIVITTHPIGGSYNGKVHAFHADGTPLTGFPFDLPIHLEPLCPAIADIDGDRRNEILVAGFDENHTEHAAFVWAFDLGGGPHGPVEWGQYGGGPRHQGRYGADTEPTAPPAPAGVPAGGRLVADLAPGAASGDPGEVAVLDDTALFAASAPGSGRELWASDGTPGGTRLVRDIRPGSAGSDPRALVRVGDAVYFTADDGVAGTELWRTDGTVAGTRLVADLWPGARGSRPLELTAIDDELWFSGQDGVHGYEPWRTDGTTAGTAMVADLFDAEDSVQGAAVGSAPTDFTEYAGAVWFRAYQSGVWAQALIRSDGTAAGTTLFRGLYGGFDPFTQAGLTVVDGLLYFYDTDDLGRTDGTDEGTTLTDWPTDRLFTEMAASSDGVVFGLRGGGSRPDERTLWVFGTTGAPVELGDRWPDGSGSPAGFVSFGDRVAFSMDGLSGSEPWATDGTAAGTVALGDLRPGTAGSNPTMLATVGDDVLFSADDGVHGHELWRSGGTAATTQRLTDLAPGPAGADVGWAVPVGDSVLVSADDGVHGRELWALTAEPADETVPDPASDPEPDPEPDPVTSRDPGSSPAPAKPAAARPTQAASPPRLTALTLSRRVVRRGRRVVVSLRASGPLAVTLTIERRHRVLARRTLRVPAHRRVRLATRRLRPGAYIVRAGPLATRLRVRR